MNKEYGAIKIEYINFTKEKFVDLFRYIRSNDLTTNIINTENNIVKVLVSGNNISKKIKNLINEYGSYLSSGEQVSEIENFTKIFRKELIELFGLDITYNLELDSDKNCIIRHINFNREGKDKMKNKYTTLRLEEAFARRPEFNSLCDEIIKNGLSIVARKFNRERANDCSFDLVDSNVDYIYLLIQGENAEEKMKGILGSGLLSDNADVMLVGVGYIENPFKYQISDCEAEKTFALIKPDGMPYIDEIRRIITESGLTISKEKETYFNEESISEYYSDIINHPMYPIIEEHLLSGRGVVMQIIGIDAVDKLKTIVGTNEPLKEKEGTIRKMFGGKIPNDVMDAAPSLEEAQRSIGIFFKQKQKVYKKEV